jgi:hypothetical protein
LTLRTAATPDWPQPIVGTALPFIDNCKAVFLSY